MEISVRPRSQFADRVLVAKLFVAIDRVLKKNRKTSEEKERNKRLYLLSYGWVILIPRVSGLDEEKAHVGMQRFKCYTRMIENYVVNTTQVYIAETMLKCLVPSFPNDHSLRVRVSSVYRQFL